MTQSDKTNTVEEYKTMILQQVEKVANDSNEDSLLFYYEKYEERAPEEKNKFRTALSDAIEHIFCSESPDNPTIWAKELIVLVALTYADEALTKVLEYSGNMLGEKNDDYEERREDLSIHLSDTIQNIFFNENNLFKPEWITKLTESAFFNPEKDAVRILLMVARCIPDEFEVYIIFMRRYLNTLVASPYMNTIHPYADIEEIVEKITPKRILILLGTKDRALKELLFLREKSPFGFVSQRKVGELLNPPQ
jgi:hypothetical protein